MTMHMTMHDRRPFLVCGTLALAWATGCADPCVDDGLLQEPQSNCPAFGGGGSTSGPDPTTTTTDTGPELPSCDNGIQDGDETDVDCGGSCQDKCGTGQGCDSGTDCQSGQCGADMTCDEPTSCTDGVLNGDETDLDCGGSCPPCDDGEICQQPADCTSQVCDQGTCTPPTCDDGVHNGSETDVDCGGDACPPCGIGEGCMEDSDCQTEVCDDGTCVGPTCRDGVLNGNETDVDCGGPDCNPCDDGLDCVEGGDCASQLCDPKTNTCLVPSCTDGVINGGETDLDCGGPCGATCEPGQGCLVGMDCLSQGCDAGTSQCNDYLSVVAAPSCSNYGGVPVSLTATASGGSGNYTYAWIPDDGSLATPDQAMTDASPDGFQSYTVTVDDGFATAQDGVVVVNSAPFDLQNNCSLYGGFGGASSVTYDMGGTRACELLNGGFGLVLCEGVSFQNVRLQGTLQVLGGTGDDDMIGLVWGGQDNSHFYSMSWKAGPQSFFGCTVPAGIVVKRVEAPDFGAMVGQDLYCNADTPQSTVLLGPASTTTAGWVAGQSYTVTIDFTDLGSEVTVVRDSDSVQMANFVVADNTFTSGFFGSTTFSQSNACTGPLFAECL